MDANKFSQARKRIIEVLESGEIKEAEQSLIQLEEKLAKDNSTEELNSLVSVWNKIEEVKKSTPNTPSPGITENELLSRMLKGQKIQNETLKSIEGYLKFFFWLAVIGLILIVISLVL